MHQSKAVYQTRPQPYLPEQSVPVFLRQMAHLIEVALLLALLLLLATLNGIRANLDGYDFEEEEYDFDSSDDDEDEGNDEPQYDYQEEEADVSPTPGTGNPPQSKHY